MRDKLEYTAHINSEGVMRIINRKRFDEDIKRFAGKDVELIVQKKRSVRSNPQNRYYWGVVVELVHIGLNDLGNDLSKQETHEFIKANFNYAEMVDENTGEILRMTKSTTRLSKSEFSEMIEKVKRFAAIFLNVEIPEPGSDLALFGINKESVVL